MLAPMALAANPRTNQPAPLLYLRITTPELVTLTYPLSFVSLSLSLSLSLWARLYTQTDRQTSNKTRKEETPCRHNLITPLLHAVLLMLLLLLLLLLFSFCPFPLLSFFPFTCSHVSQQESFLVAASVILTHTPHTLVVDILLLHLFFFPAVEGSTLHGEQLPPSPASASSPSPQLST
ncbi:hypothetical protein F4809DRAFT_79733 [Biscogniauxia mediterranea]|nr:hypothetical protein F4809DRAFT_79733 [Biscogniauxia mediterranea]